MELIFLRNFTQRSLPYALDLQCIWVCSIEWGHKAPHWDIFHPGDNQRVGEEYRTLIDVLNCDMDRSCWAGAIADIGNQRILVFHFDK